jgi:S1-C subfamily serine protease
MPSVNKPPTHIPPLPLKYDANEEPFAWYQGDHAIYYFSAFAAVGIVVLFLAVGIATSPRQVPTVASAERFELSETYTVHAPVSVPNETAELPITTLIERYEGAVVTLYTDQQSLGSGFVIKGKNLIATNYHVVRGAGNLVVETADHQLVRTLGWAAVAPEHDLALVSCVITDPKFGLELEVAKPPRGTEVITWGSSQGLQGTVSNGIVSSVRLVEDLGEDAILDPSTSVIQTTAPISQGNSGGPLMNLRGKVIGVNSFFMKEGQNLNFAVSAEHLAKLIDESTGTSYPWEQLP